MDVVSQIIIDVVFAVESPSIALNVVHPRPSSWYSIINSIADALHQKRVTPEKLPVINFSEWFDRLEQRATNVDPEFIDQIVSSLTINLVAYHRRTKMFCSLPSRSLSSFAE